MEDMGVAAGHVGKDISVGIIPALDQEMVEDLALGHQAIQEVVITNVVQVSVIFGLEKYFTVDILTNKDRIYNISLK